MSDDSVLVVVGGNETHDYDFVRPELVRLVGRGRDLRIDVRPDFSDVEGLRRARRMVSYTCDVRPAPAEEDALTDFVAGGGRWLALHSTNVVLGPDRAPAAAGHERFVGLLGSRFLSHPPIADFGVRVANTPVARQLMRGVSAFTTSDELYVLDEAAGLEVLLEVDTADARDGSTLAHLRRVGAGQVLYCSLGHAGPAAPSHGSRWCSWDVPEYRSVLDRATKWLFADS